MIDKKIYDLDYIRELQARYKTDPGLLERVLYAFGLLEALVKVGMKFTLKGGTSLMLLLDHPIRLSTDIDIIVDPGTDVESYIEQVGTIFPFLRKEEDIRNGRNNIEKNKAWKVSTFPCLCPNCDFINIKYLKIVGALLW